MHCTCLISKFGLTGEDQKIKRLDTVVPTSLSDVVEGIYFEVEFVCFWDWKSPPVVGSMLLMATYLTGREWHVFLSTWGGFSNLASSKRNLKSKTVILTKPEHTKWRWYRDLLQTSPNSTTTVSIHLKQEFFAVPPSMSHLHRFYLSSVFKRMIHNTTNMLQKNKSSCMPPLWFSQRIMSPFGSAGSW